jgi:hypothetical protein
MTRILPEHNHKARECHPVEHKKKPRLKRGWAARDVKKAVSHGRKIHPSEAHVSHASTPNMSKLQKESKIKHKVGKKLKEAHAHYKSKVSKAANKFKSLLNK